jgi:hypothetical protein
MKRIQRFNEYSLYMTMTEDLINSINDSKQQVNKDDNILSKVVSDLKLNFSLIGTFGAAIASLYPVVDSLMRNMKISSIEITSERIVLLTLAACSILYLEEKKSIKNEDIMRKDCKSMLEELKMAGIGNGIVKKLIDGLKSIKNIFNIITKHLGAVVTQFIDMFAYTALLIPIMNGVLTVIGKYNLNLDSLITNFIGLAMGIGTLLTKHGMIDILNKLKGFNIDKKKIVDEIDSPSISSGDSMVDIDTDISGELIKEQ